MWGSSSGLLSQSSRFSLYFHSHPLPMTWKGATTSPGAAGGFVEGEASSALCFKPSFKQWFCTQGRRKGAERLLVRRCAWSTATRGTTEGCHLAVLVLCGDCTEVKREETCLHAAEMAGSYLGTGTRAHQPNTQALVPNLAGDSGAGSVLRQHTTGRFVLLVSEVK